MSASARMTPLRQSEGFVTFEWVRGGKKQVSVYEEKAPEKAPEKVGV